MPPTWDWEELTGRAARAQCYIPPDMRWARYEYRRQGCSWSFHAHLDDGTDPIWRRWVRDLEEGMFR